MPQTEYIEQCIGEYINPVRGIYRWIDDTVGSIEYMTELASNSNYEIYIGKIGMIVWSCITHRRLATLLYADPEFKTKLHKAICRS